MADRRIEGSRLMRQRLVKGSVHYASTPTLATIGISFGGKPFGDGSSDSNDSGHPCDYDSSSVSNSSENGGGVGGGSGSGVYQRLFESREATFLRKRQLQNTTTASEYTSSDDSSKSYDLSEKPIVQNEDPLTVTKADVAAIESTYKGHKTKIKVCESLANLYTCPKISPMSHTVHNWILTYTGVPVLLLDIGNTRSRTRRQIQLLLVEKGTCFTLWRDIVDNLTRYTATPDGLFHTFHLSTDHSVRLGLSFDSKMAAGEFHNHLQILTSEPANIALSGPSVPTTKTHYYLDNIPERSEQQKRRKYKIPTNKMDISQPCGFQHIVSVSQSDFKKYFSLQTFVNKKDKDRSLVTGATRDSCSSSTRRKKPPAPPPPPLRQQQQQQQTSRSATGLTSSVSCHNIYALQT